MSDSSLCKRLGPMEAGSGVTSCSDPSLIPATETHTEN